jgi:hypothetical protein
VPRVSRGVAEPDLDGILVLAKPAGPTSHDIVALVRRLSGVRRVGHGGTLDPFAAGVLPVFIGRATRVVEYHLTDEKAYRAVVAFGARSTTDDLEGELTPGDSPVPSREAVEAALEPFRGTIEQVPPDYSAVRVAGRRAYELARHGQEARAQIASGRDPLAHARGLGGRGPRATHGHPRDPLLGRHVHPCDRARPRSGDRERCVPRRAHPYGERPLHDRTGALARPAA